MSAARLLRQLVSLSNRQRINPYRPISFLQIYNDFFSRAITKNSDFVRAFYLQLDALAAHVSLPRACFW